MRKPEPYRKKPVAVEAMQLIGDPPEIMEVCDWIVDNGYPWLLGNANEPSTLVPEGGTVDDPGIYIEPATGLLVIRTLEGDMRASLKDYIIKGVKGEMYPCKPDIFEATYEKME